MTRSANWPTGQLANWSEQELLHLTIVFFSGQ